MSRSISLTAKQAINAPETSEAFLILLTIDHAGFTNPIRVTSDAVDTVSGGDTFVSFPFQLNLPDDSEDREPRATLRIDNIDRSIVNSIRSINSPASVLMEIVLASDPDTIEASFPDFELRSVNYDVLVVEGVLSLESFLQEPYPSANFDPARFRGLF